MAIRTINFDVDPFGNEIDSGAISAAPYAAYGISITTNDPENFPPLIFDSENPTGGDTDLSEAEIGDTTLDNVLIVSEDGDATDPDDKANGGTLIFNFEEPVGVGSLKVLDQEEGGFVRAYDADGNLLAEIPLATPGNASVQIVDVDVEGVSRLEVEFIGSGAVDDLVLDIPLGSISGRYFCDTDNDNVDDGQAVDPGVQGVLVTLLDADGNPVLDDGGNSVTTLTGPEGNYSFADLLPGTYGVQFDDQPAGDSSVLAGKQLVEPNFGPDDTIDSDAIGNTETSKITGIEVKLGEETTDNDAGAEKTASLGDKVFSDLDRDGIQDDGEPGVENVTVTLTGGGEDGVIGTGGDDTTDVQTTDANGEYLFEDLDPGTEYKVTFSDLPAGTEFTEPDQGGDDAVDSDADTANGMTPIVTLDPGEVNRTLDAGLVTQLGSISGRYFVDAGDPPDPDLDCDGLDNDGDGTPESSGPVVGATVELLDAGGNVVATTSTGDDGGYEFTGIEAGDYAVRFAPTEGATFTKQDEGGDDTVDSDVDATGATGTITLGAGETVTDVDAGICLGSISGRYFCDTNDNDVDDGQTVDPGVAGVLVTLFDAAGNAVATTTTGDEGQYSFAKLPAGTYSVQFTDPDGVLGGKQLVDPNVGDDDTVDSDAVGDTTLSTIEEIVVTPGEETTDNDAGAEKTASLGDKVFSDLDRDGIQDDGEPGVENVTVTLTGGGEDGVIGTGGDDTTDVQTTDANGEYLFEDLDPGTEYKVTFSDLPAGTEFTEPDQGGDDAVDSDADTANGMTPIVTLDPGEVNRTLDAGLVTQLGSISGRYFVDAGDPPDPDLDCDGLDNDGDGTPESSGPVVGATVELLDAGGNVVATTSTGDDGGYEFTGIEAGDYAVRFAPTEGATFTKQDEGGDDTVDSDVDATGATGTITLGAGETVTDVDAGICLGSISGRYFCDTNDNDVDDGQTVDPGVAGVLVTLFDAAGNAVATTTTGDEGQYSFAKLPAGTYSVQFTDPDGVLGGKQLVDPNVGDDDTVDSDAVGDTTLSTIEEIVVTPGEETTDNDAGAEKTASLGDKVFSDLDRDGIQDDGEPGVENVTVTLTGGGEDGVIGTGGDDTTDVQTTDANGEYLFEDLDPGTEYKVTFSDLPAGTEFTEPDQGGDDAVDSDADTANGMTPIVTLDPGEVNRTLDAGLVTQLGSISGRYFCDLDNDSLDNNNGDEPPEAGVLVLLQVRKNGTITTIASTNTDDNGEYIFEDLPAGEYRVIFDPVEGKAFVDPNVGQVGGEDPVDDSDVVAENPITGRGATSFIDLATGEDRTDVDAGVEFTAALGDKVFLDADSDGIQDPDEEGVAGVTVTLTGGGADGVIGTADDTTEEQTTDANGEYLFEDLDPGTEYKVTFSGLPAGFEITAPDQGVDDALDSDADPANGMTPIVVLAPGEVNDTIDAGMRVSAEIDVEKFVRVVTPGAPGEPTISGDICEVAGKPVSLTFLYDNEGTGVFTDQDSDKASVTGTPDNDDEAYVVVAKRSDADFQNVSEEKDIFFAGTVLDDTEFTASELLFNNDFGSNTFLLVFEDQAAFQNGAAALQTITYHTSCSQPIILGDQLGSMTLTGYEGEEGSGEITAPSDPIVGEYFDADDPTGPAAEIGVDTVEYLYEVRSLTGEPLSNVMLTDFDDDAGVPLAEPTFVGGDDNGNGLLEDDEVWTYSTSEIAKGGQQTNTATVVATSQAGIALTDTDPANYLGLVAPPAIDLEKYVLVEGGGSEGRLVCEELGKPIEMTFLYDLDGGTVVDTDQDPSKASVIGAADDDAKAYIIVAKKTDIDGQDVAEGKDIFFAGTVFDGDTFTASELAFGEDFGGDTSMLVFEDEDAFLAGAAALQTIEYHTSCSQPIRLGDQVGTLELVGYLGEEGSDTIGPVPGLGDIGVDADEAPGPSATIGSEVKFTYVVSNTGGTALGNVELTDDRLSNVTFVGGDDDGDGLLDVDEQFVFTATEVASAGLNTNIGSVIATATDDDGTPLGLPTVFDDDPANYTGVELIAPEGDVCEIFGKPVELQFRYDTSGGNNVATLQDSSKATATGTIDGDGESYIIVSKSDGIDSADVDDGKDIFFEGTVSDGDLFTASEFEFNNDFGSNTYILVFDDETAFENGASALQTMQYHTSCSQPIEIDDQIGSMILAGYIGEDGFFFV